MKNKKGFTLTEVLLAVMIVGLIAVALASLTRAAARESGIGRSKIMLRNNLSMFMRTLRGDMAKASRVEFMYGATNMGSSSTVPLLRLAQNVDLSGSLILETVKDGSTTTAQNAKWITYCFVRGNDNTNIQPSEAYRGGKIYRLESTSNTSACSGLSDANLVLTNVKYIPPSSSVGYFVPLFARDDFSRAGTKSLLRVQIITELPSTPIVNDVVEEIFAMPNGY